VRVFLILDDKPRPYAWACGDIWHICIPWQRHTSRSKTSFRVPSAAVWTLRKLSPPSTVIFPCHCSLPFSDRFSQLTFHCKDANKKRRAGEKRMRDLH
jgi:hypothetical protein